MTKDTKLIMYIIIPVLYLLLFLSSLAQLFTPSYDFGPDFATTYDYTVNDTLIIKENKQ